MSTKWTPDRIEELRELSELLNEASALNRGSGVVDRIKNCEIFAEKLRNPDIETPRISFLQFLYTLASEDCKP